MSRNSIVAFVLALAALPAAGDKPYLDKDRTEGLAGYYRRADHWALKAMVLLALGPRWHPSGAGMVTAALQESDPRSRAFAVETLLGTDTAFLRRVASRDLVAALFKVQNATSNSYLAERARLALGRIAPYAGARSKLQWQRWWRLARQTYQPPAWREPPALPRKGERRTVAVPFLRRLFDLKNAGLDVAICIDATGSMQGPIDAARDAVYDVVEVLGAISPKFRLGLVVYRDDGDKPAPAMIVSPLVRNAKSVRQRLAALVAEGGGDYPERMEQGLGFALSAGMNWSRKANKVVILVGDAPPKDLPRAVELARAAHEHPFSSKPVTGRESPRPFVISAICVGSSAETYQALTRITKAGGGTVVRLTTTRAPAAARRASGIVKQILVLSFGKRWAAEVGAFLRIYRRYASKGVFK